MENKDFFILVDKPSNMTSQTLCSIIKRKLKLNKVGHNGTLDPETTGLMLVACNRATKMLAHLENEDKTYITTIMFGITTDTLDVFSKITDEKEMYLSPNLIDEAINKLKDQTKQIPPMTSAIKVDGKKLYEYQRKGINVSLKERDIKIFELIKLSELRYVNGYYEIDLKLKVSKGFYVRSFARDLGELLDGYAVVKKLRRVAVGDFVIDDAYNLVQIESNDFTKLRIEDIFNYKKININERILNFVRNGVTLTEYNLINDCKYQDYKNLGRFYLFYNNNMVAIYERQDDIYRPIFINKEELCN